MNDYFKMLDRVRKAFEKIIRGWESVKRRCKKYKSYGKFYKRLVES